ncbi:helix-turn-helix domain-containing protein [Streptomyces sp. NBC_01362]|uniref:helix-turn-helix domain-containing protein n=1 Tax=Streptomyces sp. NBC_01362 TaxID=2903839 RepID=UPI002E2F050A|nr:helix-turn-helix transcriptional regulator [Streptomyces sp. NBC_01362]
MQAASLGQTDADTDLDGENSEPSPDTGPAPGPADFACVLSNLQRASRHSLRALSKKSGLSPSFLSRGMNGEGFPSWEATADIARACGADPEVLKKVWDDADARRLRKPRPETLASALRFLHQRAGNPTPTSMSASSGYALTPDHITNLLDGTTIGTWEDVQTLDGEYTYFEPLWKQAAAEATASAPAPHPPGQEATNRLEELITTFNNILATGRPTTPSARPHPGRHHLARQMTPTAPGARPNRHHRGCGGARTPTGRPRTSRRCRSSPWRGSPARHAPCLHPAGRG